MFTSFWSQRHLLKSWYSSFTLLGRGSTWLQVLASRRFMNGHSNTSNAFSFFSHYYRNHQGSPIVSDGKITHFQE